jgi:hypothetical protein
LVGDEEKRIARASFGGPKAAWNLEREAAP